MGATLPPGPEPMTEPTPPPRRPLATFLRASPDDVPSDRPQRDDTSPADSLRPEASGEAAVPHTGPVLAPPHAERNDGDPGEADPLPAPAHAPDRRDTHSVHTAEGDASAPHDAGMNDNADLDTALAGTRTSAAPSFMRLPAARLHTPRWQWGVLAGLVVLLAVQIAVADRARLAADAGSRPWIAGVCSVLRCALPAWQEPAAFSMISRDVRPVPGHPGALQVQASFRNDARWAQAWPSLRLSLSDADGRVIGTGVFAPHDYLDRSLDANSVLEPGQSAQIAFRVREPAASTVAFTFEFQ
ncbi:DUF3426 domain-containing protein [Bacillus subtilis subsp. subtilis]|nr:DUF3426 domain-containing protein [Bacillus subtilis subsp. subtilis]